MLILVSLEMYLPIMVVKRVGGAGRDRPKSRSAASDRPNACRAAEGGPALMTWREVAFWSGRSCGCWG